LDDGTQSNRSRSSRYSEAASAKAKLLTARYTPRSRSVGTPTTVLTTAPSAAAIRRVGMRS
jgi:hypothetical protein